MSKKLTLGGERLGSGKKMTTYVGGHDRSSFDLSHTFYSDMNVGTLIPFMCEMALPGSTADIGLNMDCFTLPTVGPMFGTYKVQLDVFKIPIRLYQSSLHMNRNEVGQEMDKIILPKMKLKGKIITQTDMDSGIPNEVQINPSSLFPYLGVRGIGRNVDGNLDDPERDFNAIYHMAYWDIYKNFYANKQEKVGKFINTRVTNFDISWNTQAGAKTKDDEAPITAAGSDLDVIDEMGYFGSTSEFENNVYLRVKNNASGDVNIWSIADMGALHGFSVFTSYNGGTKTYSCNIGLDFATESTAMPYNGKFVDEGYEFIESNVGFPIGVYNASTNYIDSFDLKNIDKMRLDCLKSDENVPFYITDLDYVPFNQYNAMSDGNYNKTMEQNMLAIKAFQSDRFNNWLDSEYVDRVNRNSQVDVSSGSFTMDALNLAKKVYRLENQITVAGGTYQDWQEVVYGVYGGGTQEMPMYVGGLQSEVTFAEVTSNSAAIDEPLGTLAGKGKLANFKGGNIVVKCSEPSMIIGIISITPRLSYSQGNKWFNFLDTVDDFHKPEFDAIAFQDLILEEAAAWSTEVDSDGTVIQYSGGKQPSWIEYQTNVNENFGGFAQQDKLMFMVNDRQYEPISVGGSGIFDWSTYIDPSKFNYCFADTSLDSRNFWIGIGKKITMRRVMSAKQIPNL